MSEKEQRSNVPTLNVVLKLKLTFKIIQIGCSSKAMSCYNVCKGCARFRDGRESVEDDPRARTPGMERGTANSVRRFL